MNRALVALPRPFQLAICAVWICVREFSVVSSQEKEGYPSNTSVIIKVMNIIRVIKVYRNKNVRNKAGWEFKTVLFANKWSYF